MLIGFFLHRKEGTGGEGGEGREGKTTQCIAKNLCGGFVAKLMDTVHVLGEDSSVEHTLCGEVFS